MDSELDKILQQKYTHILRAGWNRYKGTVLPLKYKDFAEEIENLEVNNDDVWIASFPKSGTTWCSELIWLLANDLDYEGAKEVLDKRFVFMEISSILDFGNLMKTKNALDIPECFTNPVKTIKELKERRFIKTHLPWELMPLQIRNNVKRPKIIYVMRNPKDVCVSYYHHCRFMEGFRGTFEEYINLFLADKLNYMPYWNNLIGFWNRRHLSNILIVRYEDMKKDLPSVIRQVAKFLDKSVTDDQVKKLEHHLSFAKMKINDSVNFSTMISIFKTYNCYENLQGSFIRSGTVGSHKQELTEEQIQLLDEWEKKHNQNTGLTF